MGGDYNIVPVLRTSKVNRGGTVVIDIYASGIGNVGKNRLYAAFPYPDLIQNENPGQISPKIFEVDGEVISASDIDGADQVSVPIFQNCAAIRLPDFVFDSIPPGQRPQHIVGETDDDDESDADFPLKHIETGVDSSPPLRLELNISPDADPGYYHVEFIFTHDSGRGYRNAQASVTFQVNTLVEEWEPYPTAIVVIAGFAAVISLLYSTGFLGRIANILLGWIIATILDWVLILV